MSGQEYNVTKIIRNGDEYYLGGSLPGLPKSAFGNGSDGDCVLEYDPEIKGNTFWCAKEYNFNNLTICPNVKLRFCGQGVPIIRVKGCFLNCGTIDLHNPLLSVGASTVEKYSKETIEATCNAYYSAASSLLSSMNSCCNTLKNCLTLEKLSSGIASGGARQQAKCTTSQYGGCGGNGGKVGVGGNAGGDGTSTNSNCFIVGGASGGTSTYDNAGGGGGGGGFAGCCPSNFYTTCLYKLSEAGCPAQDGIGGKGGNGAYYCGVSGDYSKTNIEDCYGAGGSGGGGGYGYCKGGDGGDAGVIMVYYICQGNTRYSGSGVGNGGDGGNSYLGNAGKGGGIPKWRCGSQCCHTYNYGKGQPGNGGCSYCGNGGNIGVGYCINSRRGGCSIYGNGGGYNDSSTCGCNLCGGNTIYGNGGGIYVSSGASNRGGNSYYGDGGFACSAGNCYTNYGGCTIFGNGGNAYSSCIYCSSNRGGSSLYGRGGTGKYGGDGIDGGSGSSDQWGNYSGRAWGGMYGIGIFANNFKNPGRIDGHGGYGCVCSHGAKIVVGYRDSYESTGTICYVGCSTACNGSLKILN